MFCTSRCRCFVYATCFLCHVALYMCDVSASISPGGDDPRFRNPNRHAEGRIEELDSFLMDNMFPLTEERNLETIRFGLQKIVDDIVYNPEFENYYLEVMDMIIRDGVLILHKERSRLQAIISSSLEYNYNPDGGEEVKYATVRQNIINGFVDVLAEGTMTLFQEGAFKRKTGDQKGDDKAKKKRSKRDEI